MGRLGSSKGNAHSKAERDRRQRRMRKRAEKLARKEQRQQSQSTSAHRDPPSINFEQGSPTPPGSLRQ